MASEAPAPVKRSGSIMEWTEVHELNLAREVRITEPWRLKPRTLERGRVWEGIVNRLNECTLGKFSVKKKSVREHFNLMLEKYKAKRRNEAMLSGVNVEDSELDVVMEEISEKWEEAERQDLCTFTNKQKAEADRASGEEIRKKACEKLGETSERKAEEPQPKKTRRSGSDTLEFLREKLAVRQVETERQAKAQEELVAAQKQQQLQQTAMLGMMQQQNSAILQLLVKMADRK